MYGETLLVVGDMEHCRHWWHPREWHDLIIPPGKVLADQAQVTEAVLEAVTDRREHPSSNAGVWCVEPDLTVASAAC